MIRKHIRRFLKIYLVIAALVSIEHRTFAQDHGTYHSDVDDLLTVEKVSVLPFTDNLQGIYARPLEAHFISLVDKMHRWDYIAANTSGAILSPEELEASPDNAKQASSNLGVDAFFAARITKGPNGITIHLSLFLSKDGKLISQAILKDYKQFDLGDLKEQVQRLLSEITSRLPYSGRIMSRESNRVTVNLGQRDGLQVGQMLSVIQIIQAQRHPKFNFLVRTDKEIFGKVKVLKVDETLSFGVVITEKEKGAIQKGAKIGALDFVSYPSSDSLSLTPTPEEALTQREDSQIAFGKDAKAWQPSSTPSFGMVGGRFGLGQFSQSSQLSGNAGGLSATEQVAPLIGLEGEIWITPEWTFYARLKQAIVQLKNPRTGSAPTNLNQSISEYEGGFGYMVRFGPYIWSPFVEPYLGYFNYKSFTDTSYPEAFNTLEYTGFKFGLRGASPIDATGIYGFGGDFSMAWKPGLRESPYTSGSSSNNVLQIAVFVYKKLGERLKAQAQLDFDVHSTNFSGDGTRTNDAISTSLSSTTVTGGIYYLF